MGELGEMPIETSVSDGIGWLTLNRPAAINAINDGIRGGVKSTLADFDSRDDVRVIVVRGNGDRGFCAGADIKEFRPPETTAVTRARMAQPSWIETFDGTRKPVVASIHGFCLGGGLELALACDIRLASVDAQFGLPEVNLGLIPGGGGTQRLANMIGLGRTLDMILSGDRIDANEAHRIGLVSRLFTTREALAEGTAALARQIAEKYALATRYAKEAVLATRDLSGLRVEKDLFAMLMSSEDRVAAVTEFQRKRQAGAKGGNV